MSPSLGWEYATEVSKFVAQGASRDFRRAYENWRNPELRAAIPTFKRKNRGTTALSWPPPAWTGSSMTTTAVSGCPTWAR